MRRAYFVIPFVLIACSGERSVQREFVSPLNQEQSDRLLNTLGDIGLAISAINAVTPQGRAQTVSSLGVANTACDATTVSQDREEMTATLANALRIGDCEITGSLPKDLNIPFLQSGRLSIPEPLSFEYRIGGEFCPIDLSFKGESGNNAKELTDAKQPLKGQTTYTIEYKVQSRPLASFAKIDRATLKGSSTYEKLGADSKTVFEITGDAHSLADGDIVLGFRVDSDIKNEGTPSFAGIAKQILSVQYREFGAQLVADSSHVGGKTEETFLLNNEKLTRDQYFQYLTEAGMDSKRAPRKRER